MSGPNFSGENGLGGPFFLEFWSPGPIFSPDQNFRDSTNSIAVSGLGSSKALVGTRRAISVLFGIN